MRIPVDENIPVMTAQALRELGHDVTDVRGTEGEGMSDAAVWRLAQVEGRLLVTTDRGFAAYRYEHHSGLLVVRLRQPNRTRIHRRVLEAVAQFEAVGWTRLLVVMRDRTVSTWRAPALLD